SLPKVEALSLVVPGLFGYRSDSSQGAVYWGLMGHDPAWETFEKNGKQEQHELDFGFLRIPWYTYAENGSRGKPPTGFYRYTGGGNYAGELVVLVALWAGAQSLRRQNPIFEPSQRKWLWFWGGVAVIAL